MYDDIHDPSISRKSTITTGAAGEHYAMFRLLSLGHIAALAPTGATGVDILISDDTGDNLAAIQAKTSGNPVTVGWRMDAKHEQLNRPSLFYCFIDPGHEAISTPTCWIVPSKVVAEHVTATRRPWLAGSPLRGQTRKDRPGRKMHVVCDRPVMDAYPDGWMEQYREAWHLLIATDTLTA